MNKKSFYGIAFRLLLILPVIFIYSCQSLLDVGDNVVRTFGAPLKVKNKIKEPLGDSVKLSALWIGHATLLIQIYDKVILTDPLLTDNVAEVLRRYVEPGMELNSLKKLDLVLLSHSHSDHLSFGSLKMIEKKFPGTEVIFPEGVEEFLPDYNFNYIRMKKASEKNKVYIGETITADSVKITTVAAFHWGGKYGLDGKLWIKNGYCGFIIQYKDVTVFYTGDTSYDKDFYKYIGERYNIDLEIVNIIYCDECKDINKNEQHIYPMGAIKIFDDSKAKYMIPAHYGTFTDPYKLGKVLKKMYHTNENYKERVKILKIGEQFSIKK